MGERKGDIIGLLRELVSANTALQGGIASGEYGRERVEDIVLNIINGEDSDFAAEARKLAEGNTDDCYGLGKWVSIEEERNKQLNLQEELDRLVVEENCGISHHDKHGLLPCQRARRGEF